MYDPKTLRTLKERCENIARKYRTMLERRGGTDDRLKNLIQREEAKIAVYAKMLTAGKPGVEALTQRDYDLVDAEVLAYDRTQ